MQKRIGLEIGTNETKIIMGHSKRDEFIVKDFRIIKTQDGVFSPEGDIDILMMEMPIKKALEDMHVKEGHLFVSINNEKVIIRTRELPRVAVKDMIDVVRFEAENFLPYNIDEFYVDYKVLSEIDDDTNSVEASEKLFNVMIIAAPIDIVKQYLHLADNLKLKLNLVTAYTEALNRYVSKKILVKDRNVLFVDIGSSYSNMIMYQGLQYYANIKSDVSINSIKTQLIETHNLTTDEVEYQLFTKGTDVKNKEKAEPKDKLDIYKNSLSASSNTESNKLLNLQKKLEKIRKLKTTMDSPESELVVKRNAEYAVLIKEINRMVEFFKSRKYGTFVDEIYILGGGANLKDFIDLLNDEVGIKCSRLTNSGFESIPDVAFDSMIPSLGVCIGGRN